MRYRLAILALCLLGAFASESAWANRYYSPELGRFISRDPIGYEDGFGLYQYATSSPIATVDSMGLCACCCCIEDLEWGDVEVVPPPEGFWGHRITAKAKLSYHFDSNANQNCTMEWWERSTHVPTAYRRMGIGDNEWADVNRKAKEAGRSTEASNVWDKKVGESFADCPNDIVEIFMPDEPTLTKEEGKKVSRTLFFAVVVRSGEGCNCKVSEKTIFATQKLSIDGWQGKDRIFKESISYGSEFEGFQASRGHP